MRYVSYSQSSDTMIYHDTIQSPNGNSTLFGVSADHTCLVGSGGRPELQTQ